MVVPLPLEALPIISIAITNTNHKLTTMNYHVVDMAKTELTVRVGTLSKC
eukprot:m.78461 g.78461  ORF g.78461 m.78461 type:complete len:50 (+) comp14503_c0_seq9:2496-2645(+)